MERMLKTLRVWGAPAAAVVFFVLWCVAEAGRMGGSLAAWGGTWMLVAFTLAIASSAWQPLVSTGIVGAALAAQLAHALPSPEGTNWAIYIGSFIALGFALWTAQRRTVWIAAGANLVFAAAMTFILLSWRYGVGYSFGMRVGSGDRLTLTHYGLQTFAYLLFIAAVPAAVGLLLRALERQGSLFRQRTAAEDSLRAAEVDLVVEQERTRIARDLHDVLAHSLAVIAAQADGARYLGKGQPQPVLDALETIAGSARRALGDAQRVIEGVRDEGPVPPQPTLGDVAPLLEQMRGSLRIERSETGTPAELSTGQQLAVFRIVQECLTNALRHGGRGTAVRVHLDWSGPGLTLHVASAVAAGAAHDGVARGAVARPDAAEGAYAQGSGHDAAGSPGRPPRPGRGIPGMRERAHLAGGWLTAGPDGEDFRVTAFIPYGNGAVDSPVAGEPLALEAAGEGARG